MEFVKDHGRWMISDRLEAGQEAAEPKEDLLAQVQRVILARGESSLVELARILDVDARAIRRVTLQGQQESKLAVTSSGQWYVPELGEGA
jgi:hypothetical protein